MSGEKGSCYQLKGEPQDFYQLRDQCLQNSTLFEDPEFPPVNSSLFFSTKPVPERRFEWKRPKEIVKNPKLFVDGFSRFDVQQGELGNCWLLAAMANLTLCRRIFLQIVPDDQGFEEDYAGIFHFRFWHYSRWIEVVIDDRLPTYQGKLIYLHSNEDNEFWSALLEKAYAKFYGCYEALKDGFPSEAMVDFTGGIAEMYKTHENDLFKIILKGYERCSLMGGTIEPDPHVFESTTQEGLVQGHAYSITKVQYVKAKTGNGGYRKIPLLRLRNPWGNKTEWNGAFSDDSTEWQYISDIDKKEKLHFHSDADGEFWMLFKDFQKNFHHLEICNLNPDSLSDNELTDGRNKKWAMSVFENKWVQGVNAGGRNLENFWRNPQYRVTLSEADEGDEAGLCTMIVALMQKNRRRCGKELLFIGFQIYHLPDLNRLPKVLKIDFFTSNFPVNDNNFKNLREVSCRFKLSRGTYCIVPCTVHQGEEEEFLLRVFSEHQNNMEVIEQEIGLREMELMANYVQIRPDEIKENGLMELFTKAVGKDREVDWHELQEILTSARKGTKYKVFSKEVCRSMIAMLDADRSGKLNFEEFKHLWTHIQAWESVFKAIDTNNSGTLSGFELQDALNSAGYNLNNHILGILMRRYGNKAGEIEFDDFIMCAIKLRIIIGNIESSKSTAKGNAGTATFTMEKWIETTLYS